MAQQAPKKNPANEPLDPDVVEKLGKVFLLISSPNDGEALTALRMFNRALEANGVDHHTLVARMAKPWLSDSSKDLFKTELANAKRYWPRRGSEGSRIQARRSKTTSAAPTAPTIGDR